MYAELMLLAVALGVGVALVHVASGVAGSLRDVEPPPRLSAYRVGSTVIVANWGETPYAVRLVCLDTGEHEEVEVAPGTHLYNTTCSDLALVYRGHVVRPVRVA